MVSVELLPRKVFEITLSSGQKITGQFGTWALKRFCDKKKYSLEVLEQRFTSKAVDIDDVVGMILAAVEHYHRRNKLDYNFTDIDACEWIDELGGIASAETQSIFNHSASSLEDAGGEKKSALNGTILSEAT